jgi:[ribosomal protein S18]-alanine N-acetyltransferase
MIVRPATRADAEALGQVHAEAFEAPWSGGEVLRFAEDRGGVALVAEGEDGETAGFILCRLIAGEAEVLTLAVRTAARRRGVATALLSAAIDLTRMNAASMFLEVAEDNPGALALYARAGFEPVGRRAGYYARQGAPAAGAIVMRRTLNS